MASTASTSLNLELQTQGENDGTWGDKQKVNMTIIDAAIAGRTTVTLNGANATLADADYTLDAAKYALLYTSDADQDDRAIIIPNAPRIYRVINASASYQIGVKTSGGSAITIPLQSVATVSCDGSDNMTFVSPITNYTTGAPNTSSGAAASTVSVTPSGDLTSTDVQAGLVELQADIDAIEADLLANYQPLDADLTAIAGLARSKGALIVGGASAWLAQSVGTNDYAMIADSAQSTGVKWGVLPVAGGGTGSTTAAAARTALGLAIGSDVQAWDADLDTLSGLAKTDGNFIVGNGSAWTVESGATARASLGLTIGTHVQAYDAGLTSIAGLTTAADRMIYTTASDMYAVATLTSTARSLLDDTSTSAMRTTLGLAIGTDVQAYDADLTTIGGLAKTDGNFIVGNGSAWVAESGATARASLGLTIGTDVQAYDADLAAIAGLTRAKGSIIAGSSSAWTAHTVGTDGYALIADSASTAGVKWAALIPAGTSMLFYQASAPTGWTAVAQNDKALRVVSAGGTGGSAGGTTAFTSVFTSRTIAEANLPSHTHSFSATTSSDGSHQHLMFNSNAVPTTDPVDGSTYASYGINRGTSFSYQIGGTATTPTAGLTKAEGAHTHTVSGTSGSTGSGTAMDFAVQYCDVIICTKDAY